MYTLLSTNRRMLLCSCYHNRDTEHLIMCLFAVSPHLPLLAPDNHWFPIYPCNCTFVNIQTRHFCRMQSFCGWLLSRSTMLLRAILVGACISRLFLLMLSRIPSPGHRTILLTHLPTNSLGLFSRLDYYKCSCYTYLCGHMLISLG